MPTNPINLMQGFGDPVVDWRGKRLSIYFQRASDQHNEC